MKIPKRIEDLLNRRMKAGIDLLNYGVEIDQWCYKHDIRIETEDGATGAEAVADPRGCTQRIRKLIEEHKE